jgi:hypothetical protein
MKTKNRFFDFKIGFAGAIVMGIVVFSINYYGTKDLTGGLTAALKQAVYTFFFGGTIMKICENVAVGVKKRRTALIAAVVVPSTISLLLTFGMHNLKGTPKPLASTIPTAIFVIPSTAVWGMRKRKQFDLQKKDIIPKKTA